MARQQADAFERCHIFAHALVAAPSAVASAKAFLKALDQVCPLKIQKILTDNGKEFTDRLFACRKREPSGQHEFDQLCRELRIEHRLTRPRTPKTNGLVERFNGRIADVLKTHRFASGEDLEQTLTRYAGRRERLKKRSSGNF